MTPGERAAQMMAKAKAEGKFNENGEWWEDGVLMAIDSDQLAGPEDIPEGGWPDQQMWATGRAARLIW